VIEDSEEIQQAYANAAQQGCTEPPDATEEVECHYVCFTKASEHALWLMDGDRDGPMKSDRTLGDNEDILEGAGLEVIRDFIKESSLSNPCNVGIMALVRT
jgi:ubiquitin carboxyl-terminal hydrolase L3